MNAGDADIVEAVDAVAHELGGELGFFGDGNVAGAGGDDADDAFTSDLAIAFDGDGPGELVKFRCVVQALYGREGFFVGAGDQNILAGVSAEHAFGDFGDLAGRFAFAEDNFGKTLTESPVMVDFGKSQVFEGQMFQAFDGGFAREFAGANGFHQLHELRFVHVARPRRWLDIIIRHRF